MLEQELILLSTLSYVRLLLFSVSLSLLPLFHVQTPPPNTHTHTHTHIHPSTHSSNVSSPEFISCQTLGDFSAKHSSNTLLQYYGYHF